MFLRVGSLAIVLSIVLACGGGSAPPASPTPPPAPSGPTVTGLTFGTTLEWLLVQRSEQLTATATMSDGSTRTVPATWSTDAPTVASITRDGLLRGTGPGMVKVQAAYEGRSATRDVRVIPEYGGTWSGAYHIVRCEETDDWRGLACEDEDPNDSWLFTGEFTRQGIDGFSGTVVPYIDVPPVPLSGTIAVDGRVTAHGVWQDEIEEEDYVLRVEVSDWEVLSTNSQTLSGTFTLTTSVDFLDGVLRYFCDVTMTREGALPSAARPKAPQARKSPEWLPRRPR